MTFRLAKLEEKDYILSLYDENRNETYTAWNENYPTMDNILNDIKTNNLYVLAENDIIIGSISINSENEVTDEPLFSSNKAFEFGRVVVSKKYRGKGYGKILVQNIEKMIKEREYDDIHILVYENSIVANSMYKSLGYTYIGTKTYSDIIFNIYEKKI